LARNGSQRPEPATATEAKDRPEEFETVRARNRTGAGNGPFWRLGALRFLAVTACVNWCRPRGAAHG
jgi:hypothetical protein